MDHVVRDRYGILLAEGKPILREHAVYLDGMRVANVHRADTVGDVTVMLMDSASRPVIRAGCVATMRISGRVRIERLPPYVEAA